MIRPLIIANWKMNPVSSKEAFDLAAAVAKGLQGVGVEVVLCSPFVYLQGLIGIPAFAKGYGGLALGSQDCFWEGGGAYTGQISPQMLKNLGCSYVILGHSERKRLGETLEMVAKKIQAALDVALIPVVCIGKDVEKEMEIIFHGIRNWKLKIKNFVLVYEPENAISTQKNAKPEISQDIKKVMEKMRKVVGEDVPLLYGGSVDAANIRSILQEGGAQGALVGAASLDAQEFVELVKNAIPR